MGKGDKKTRRGKITIGTYGVRRPRKKTKSVVISEKPKKKTTTKKATPKETTAKK